MEKIARRQSRGSRRGRHHGGRFFVDGHTARENGRGRKQKAPRAGAIPTQARCRTAGGDFRNSEGAAPLARRAERPEAPNRLIPFPRADGRRQDLPCKNARRTDVREAGGADSDRHVGVYGKILGVQADRLAARIRRARRRRPAHRASSQTSLQCHSIRRNRKGASGCRTVALAGARRRQAH